MKFRLAITLPLKDPNGEINLDTGIKCSLFPNAFLIGFSFLGLGIFFAVRDK